MLYHLATTKLVKRSVDMCYAKCSYEAKTGYSKPNFVPAQNWNIISAWNTNWRGSSSTIDLLNKVAYFVLKNNKFFNRKSDNLI